MHVCTFKTTDELLYGPWEIYAYMPRPDGSASSLRELGFEQAVVVVIAEKGSSSRFDVNPVQWVYRDDRMKQHFNERLAALTDGRPVFGFGGHSAPAFVAIKKGGFHHCGRASA